MAAFTEVFYGDSSFLEIDRYSIKYLYEKRSSEISKEK